jgi:5-methylcytosine-specific restriction endonuclease McrA
MKRSRSRSSRGADRAVASGSRRQTRRRPAVVKPPARKVPAGTHLLLYVRAGGRCQFDGCNRYLLEHHLTKTEGNFAQMAHIWAFSERGPRGGRRRPRDAAVHAVSNLMLLCPECHKLVDDRPDEFTTRVLREHKKAHEDRVFMLTETQPERHTVALVLKAKIGNKSVSISFPEIQQAAAPRYLGPRDVVSIDLTAIRDKPVSDYWRLAAEAVDSRTRALYEQTFENGPARHISVFALGPIPLLVHLGTRLSDKVPLTLYQRHRNTEGWRWKDKGKVAAYGFRTIHQGRDAAAAALVLSLSGRIREDELPDELDRGMSVYEITLSHMQPTPRFLEREESLHAFRDAFLAAMRRIVSWHRGLKLLHLFPAVPAPVAVAVGRDLMTKRDPAVLVYDYDKRAGGFVPALEVNRDEPE